MLKKSFKLILQKISRVIYHLTPEEFKFKEVQVNDYSGLIKLLSEYKNKETFEFFLDKFKNSVPFMERDTTAIRKYAIDLALSNKNENSEELYYLEFGVYDGTSANFFSEHVKNLYAFDSFQGLPEDWKGVHPKGTFSLKNKIPKLNSNVHMIVGWVEDTLDEFLEQHNPKINFVHLDMDLYKPTKFTLQKIKPFLINKSIILFDELYNYINWKEGEFKALTEVFSNEEYEYKAFRLNGCQVVIEINKY